MTPERWQRIDKLLEQALDQEPDRRDEFLDEACKGDEALRREVDSLLSSHRKAGEFIEAGPLKTGSAEGSSNPRAILPGRTVGHYQILSELGQGGMGKVYQARDHKAGTPGPLISSSFLDHTPQFSPDGQKIAFASYRSGHAEIWVCDSDGSNAFQLTSFAGADCNSPRWSPNGQQIAFSANQEGQREVYVIGAEGGKVWRLTIHPAVDRAPSWSRDGKWIYFDSNRTGEFQVWKMSTQGGDAVQVTKNGGWIPLESPDGRYTYFLKPEEPVSSLWRISADGVESQILDSVYAINFEIVKDGIYFMPAARDGRFAIHFLSLSSGKTSPLASITRFVVYGFSVSPDERWILYPQADHLTSDLMLVENFLGSRSETSD
jgi:Tol biopolymer transport system component